MLKRRQEGRRCLLRHCVKHRAQSASACQMQSAGAQALNVIVGSASALRTPFLSQQRSKDTLEKPQRCGLLRFLVCRKHEREIPQRYLRDTVLQAIRITEENMVEIPSLGPESWILAGK